MNSVIKQYFQLRKIGMTPSAAWFCSMDNSAIMLLSNEELKKLYYDARF